MTMSATPLADFTPLIVHADITSTQFPNKLTVLTNGNIVVSSAIWGVDVFLFGIVDASTTAITNIAFDPNLGVSGTALASQPLGVIAAGDGFLAVWTVEGSTGHAIRAQYFAADGTAVGGIVTLASDSTPGVNDDPGDHSYWPLVTLYDLTVQSDGSIVVSFNLTSEEDAFSSISFEYDTKAVIVTVGVGGISGVGPVFDIENGPNYASTLRLRPLPEGGFFAAGPEEVADDALPSDTSHTEYVIRTFDSAGVQQQRIVTDVPIWQYQDNVVAMGGGRFAILSTELTDWGNKLSFNIIDETGQRIVEPVRLATDYWATDDYFAKLVFLDDGSFAAVWSPDSSLAEAFVLQRFAADGTLLGDQVVITDGDPETYTEYFPEVALDPLGRLVVSWYEYNPIDYQAAGLSETAYTQRFTFPDAFAGDIMNGTGGNDTQQGTVYQDLLLGFSGDDVQVGRGGKDQINGGGGDDIQRGGYGRDRLEGGAGDDRQYGGSGNDKLVGGQGGDRMFGQAGNDMMKGDADNDWLRGGDGDDTLRGGAGRDVLFGESGADTFLYANAGDSGLILAERDVIRDFQQGIDVIDLSLIDAHPGGGDQAFTFIGTNGLSGSQGELRYWNTPNGRTIVAADITGDGVADMRIELFGTLTLTDLDFVL
jgi:Ca2+-binding RTX toxin-like protein